MGTQGVQQGAVHLFVGLHVKYLVKFVSVVLEFSRRNKVLFDDN